MSDIARAEMRSGNLNSAELHVSEALRIAKAIDDREGIIIYTGNLADIALYREDWTNAEILARQALSSAEVFGRLELIGVGSYRIAKALMRQGKKAEAIPHARRAVDICARLGSWRFSDACEILSECEN